MNIETEVNVQSQEDADLLLKACQLICIGKAEEKKRELLRIKMLHRSKSRNNNKKAKKSRRKNR